MCLYKAPIAVKRNPVLWTRWRKNPSFGYNLKRCMPQESRNLPDADLVANAWLRRGKRSTPTKVQPCWVALSPAGQGQLNLVGSERLGKNISDLERYRVTGSRHDQERGEPSPPLCFSSQDLSQSVTSAPQLSPSTGPSQSSIGSPRGGPSNWQSEAVRTKSL